MHVNGQKIGEGTPPCLKPLIASNLCDNENGIENKGKNIYKNA